MVGIDIIQLSRIRITEALVKEILSEDEMNEYREKNNDAARIRYIGGRFAAKEAVFKATQKKEYKHCSILNDETGKPYVKDHPELSVSITHDGDYAAAVAMVMPQ